mmetsp:Transcript_44528/g.107860  ORF Transcript_44528/g.107860 Transcript_44528/m.107860 type:complete len:580 (+) Transcript_44528:174-1913(+)
MRPATTAKTTKCFGWRGGDGTSRFPTPTSSYHTYVTWRMGKIKVTLIVLVLLLAVVVSFNIFTLIVWHHRQQLHTTTHENDNENDISDAIRHLPSLSTTPPQPPPPPSSSTCAILLFGLPRAFKQYVLPSFIENVVKPNLRYQCDYYMHYYADKVEGRSRSGHGGQINPDDVWLLPQAIHDVVRNTTDTSSSGTLPIVSLVNDTNTTFWETRHDELMKFRNTKILDDDGNLTYKYFPWKEPTYVWPDTLDNMVRQWHSIERVWDHMMSVVEQRKNKKPKMVGYDRVAMMRNDVVYIAPIDIYKIPPTASSRPTPASATSSTKDESIRRAAFGGEGKGSGGRGFVVQSKKAIDPVVSTSTSTSTPILYDYDNQYVVIPNWAKYPINDRYISGPFNAVRIWATQRFLLIDEYAGGGGGGGVSNGSGSSGAVASSSEFNVRFPPPEVGRVMHSESFVNATILNIIRNQFQYYIAEDNWVCFLRVRADGAIWIDDCHGSMVGFGGDEESVSDVGTSPGFPGDVREYVQPFLPPGASCRKRRLRDKVRIVMELVCKPTGGRGPAVVSAAGQTRRKGFTKRNVAS